MRLGAVAREATRRELGEWLAAGDPTDAARVITGSAGCGKTQLVRSVGRDFDAVVDATGASAADLAVAVNEELGLDRGPLAGEVSPIGVSRAAGERGRPFLVAITNVEHAGGIRCSSVPDDVLTDLLSDLLSSNKYASGRYRPGREADFPSVRLVVELPKEQAAVLAREAGLPAGSVVDLDDAHHAPDRTEFEAWITRLLAAPGTPYAEAPVDVVRAIAAEIADRSSLNFLLAEATTIVLRTREARWSPSGAEQLPGTLAEVWDLLLASQPVPRSRLSELLAPIALAEGTPGMPQEVWQAAASNLLGEHVPARQLEDAAALTGELIERTAVPTASGEVTCWRIRHEALGRAAAVSLGSDTRLRVLSTIASFVPSGALEATRTAAERYALGAGPGHAAGAFAVDNWIADPRCVLLSQQRNLENAVRGAGHADTDAADRRRRVVLEASRTFRDHPERSLAEHAARLQWSATVCGDEVLCQWLDECGLALPWRTLWASWRPLGELDTDRIDPRWPGPVALAGGQLADGEEQVCLRNWVGRGFQWWSLAEGEPVGPALSSAPDDDWPQELAEESSDLEVELDEESDHGAIVARLSAAGMDSAEEWMINPVTCDTDAHVLPGRRVVLAGIGGVALLQIGAAPQRRFRRLAADRAPVQLSRWRFLPAWRGDVPLQRADLEILYRVGGGPVTVAAQLLGPLAADHQTARLLTEVGLPANTFWFTDMEKLLPMLQTAEEHFGPGHGGHLRTPIVLGRVRDGWNQVVCVESNGVVTAASPASNRPVNASLAEFLRCLAVATWGLGFATTRDDEEYGQFRRTIHDIFRSIAPSAIDGDYGDRIWNGLIGDEMTYRLE
ncbi:SUKH-4 family immunity protein [Saccharopolyspora sp. NPDC050642]|uniref:SUKH-4 family immunity protein n=1 Tax=Saccharopolyspora sp. NPDC050642 TaxID=3157099 RepID=UPI0033DC6A67